MGGDGEENVDMAIVVGIERKGDMLRDYWRRRI
jgi:hypothetical protein